MLIVPPSTLATHTITTSANAGGSITLSGSLTVIEGANQVFTVTADAGYLVDTVTIDGTPMTANKYIVTFAVPNVTGAHTVAVTFKEDNAATPTITTQPASGSYRLDAAATPLTVDATVTDGGTLTYQWYQNSTNSTTGSTAIPGATGTSYLPDTSAQGTIYYYCVVTNTNTAVTGTQTVDAASTIVEVVVARPNSSTVGGTTSLPNVSVTKPTNGTVKASPTSPKKGDTVTITTTPNEGYEVGGIAVKDKSGNTLPVSENSDGTYSFTYDGNPVTIEANFVPLATTPEPPSGWQNPFTDVNESDWFYGDVQYVEENGLMTGTSADKFDPEKPMTRGMLVTVLFRMAGSPEPKSGSNFEDLTQDWYAKAVAWASENGIVGGYDAETFGPDDNITREQAAVILERYMAFAKINIATTDEYRIFADEDDISDYAKNAIQLMNKLGIMNGVGENTINPQGDASRAEVAAMLHRFLELVK
ncbi:S-layer homology domain-containing protein [Oscillospiraceae bacterium OttesenSCG-928-G22]|nr:S-layer homology domain-containing protein [Oscillospiraceae bacterium OttesenSCG-928-G22]